MDEETVFAISTSLSRIFLSAGNCLTAAHAICCFNALQTQMCAHKPKRTTCVYGGEPLKVQCMRFVDKQTDVVCGATFPHPVL
eukprot:6068129-Amphidinium_carterae.1